MANKIDDVINELQKEITYLDWRDETRVTMRIDQVQKILKRVLDLAQGSQGNQKFDLTTQTTNTTLVFDVNGTPITAGSNVLKYGDKLRITATAQTGYTLDTLTVNGNTFTNGDVLTVLDDLTVVASSTINKYSLAQSTTGDITLAYTIGGEPIDVGTDVLTYGDELTITATVGTGYEVTTLTVNGQSFVSGSTYTVTENVNVIAEASLQVFDLSITADEGITLSIYKNGQSVSAGTDVLTYGDVLTFVVDPSESVVKINNQVYTTAEEFTVVNNVSIIATAPQQQ